MSMQYRNPPDDTILHHIDDTHNRIKLYERQPGLYDSIGFSTLSMYYTAGDISFVKKNIVCTEKSTYIIE